MSKILRLSLAAAVATFPGLWTTASGQAHQDHVLVAQADQVEISQSAIEIRVAMRTLWEDHITYTRNYIISALAGLPDEQAMAERLLRNQDDIGNAIKPYYGDEAGNKLAALLRDHILIATEVVSAAKAGDNQQLTAAQEKWSANGKDIAAFLAAANPNWSKAELDAYFAAHELPRHPLEAQGYPSIGCSPCTSKVQPGEDPRAGRWRGWDKVECGIHTLSTPRGDADDPANQPVF